MSEISKNKRKKSLTNEKIRKDIYGIRKMNDNIINFSFDDHIIKEDNNKKLSNKIKHKNSNQLKLVTKIEFLFNLLLFINLYYFVYNSEIIIKAKFKKLNQKYKILNCKYFNCPSKINNQPKTSDYGNSITINADKSIIFTPTQNIESHTFDFLWNDDS